MPDSYDRILQVLSKKLPNKEDVELLESIVNSLRKGGRDEAESNLKALIKKLGATD